MSNRKRISVFLDPQQIEGLKAIKQRDLVPEAASIRQAINEYVARKGLTQSVGDSRAKSRKRRKGTA